MAFVPYFVLGPTALMGLVGLLHGPDSTTPTPQDDWRTATVDLLIPAFNEEKTIIICLASIFRQTLKPRQIYLYDDASNDKTIQYARLYAQLNNIKLNIIPRSGHSGKTPSVCYAAEASDADVLAVVDGDTILKSDHYLERLVQELYQGVGIACACGFVLPLTEDERNTASQAEPLDAFRKKHPDVLFSPDQTWFQKTQRALTNVYREELYLFLHRFIYRGEMTFFGTLIFPVGCAVAYRRVYLKTMLDHYTSILGFDLTTSEDIFFGFALAEQGYRNISVPDVFALTTEPRFFKLFSQIFKWSSSFLQSCYYFDNLFYTPFKYPRYLIHSIKKRFKPIIDKRKIKEAYRQSFGIEYTEKYGRKIGWFVFTTAFEKISYPVFIVTFMILGFWGPLLITLGAEVFLYTLIITAMHQNRRIRNFFKAILFTPIRYSQILFDLVVIGCFLCDLWLTQNRRWRK